MIITNAPIEVPEHAAKREPGHQIIATRMIGRLADSEFDLLDAISANTRAGISPDAIAIARTLGITISAVFRRLYRARTIGLVDAIQPIDVAVGGVSVAHEYHHSDTGSKLFREVLDLMDRGLVDAA